MLTENMEKFIDENNLSFLPEAAADSHLLVKIRNKTATVVVVGLGYVGIPLVKRLGSVGFKVIGYDIDDGKVDLLREGSPPFSHYEKNYCQHFSDSTTYEFTSSREAIRQGDVIIVCVPTPLTKNNQPDLSYIESAFSAVIPFVRKDVLISLESTTFPGTTECVVAPILADSGFTVGKDIYLGYSPEREDPGNKKFEIGNTPKIISGMTTHCLQLMHELYSHVSSSLVPVSNPKTAEMTKIIENTQRFVNIGLVNELKLISEKMGINIFEVINAAATKPFGFTPYYPGPGIGGHCIPVDPHYLNWKSKEFGIRSRFIELAEDINQGMPLYVVARLQDKMNQQFKTLRSSKILILGVSYKENIGDVRESPALSIIKELLRMKAEVQISDPYIDKLHINDVFFESIRLEQLSVEKFDAVIIVTRHDNIDYHAIAAESRLIIDSRGVYPEENIKIIRA